jgi:hypothetical protein
MRYLMQAFDLQAISRYFLRSRRNAEPFKQRLIASSRVYGAEDT